jgi:hypothetical protein
LGRPDNRSTASIYYFYSILTRRLQCFKNRRSAEDDRTLPKQGMLQRTGRRDGGGTLISEEYDFGSAKEINGLYQDLLRITPFSANEAKKYSHFLSDRNLLVHHRGVFSYNYASQRFARAYRAWSTPFGLSRDRSKGIRSLELLCGRHSCKNSDDQSIRVPRQPTRWQYATTHCPAAMSRTSTMVSI